LEDLPLEMKEFIIEKMKGHGALAKTFNLLKEAEDELLAELQLLEVQFDTPNPILHAILKKLKLAEDNAP
jgi:geranylgeranyl pyrophosphate synthase